MNSDPSCYLDRFNRRLCQGLFAKSTGPQFLDFLLTPACRHVLVSHATAGDKRGLIGIPPFSVSLEESRSGIDVTKDIGYAQANTGPRWAKVSDRAQAGWIPGLAVKQASTSGCVPLFITPFRVDFPAQRTAELYRPSGATGVGSAGRISLIRLSSIEPSPIGI
jgi:hypothetical protein